MKRAGGQLEPQEFRRSQCTPRAPGAFRGAAYFFSVRLPFVQKHEVANGVPRRYGPCLFQRDTGHARMSEKQNLTELAGR